MKRHTSQQPQTAAQILNVKMMLCRLTAFKHKQTGRSENQKYSTLGSVSRHTKCKRKLKDPSQMIQMLALTMLI